jgi:diadenosine tetraphosphate (Ap4A) HIT family hydrolase
MVTASESGCVFCAVAQGRIAWSSPSIIALWDAFPVSPGHALVVPRRHVASWRDLTPDEKTAITTGVDAVRALIDARHRPDGYNVGYNDGVAAGQTVMHFHMHVIPRYRGDVRDPRGGVRLVLPDKAAYWQSAEQ